MSLIYPDFIHPADAIRMAIEHEKQSQAFYEKAARMAEDPGAKKMFKELVRQEIEHQRILEEELDRGIYKDN